MEIHSGSRTLEAPRRNRYAPARGLLVMNDDDGTKIMKTGLVTIRDVSNFDHNEYDTSLICYACRPVSSCTVGFTGHLLTWLVTWSRLFTPDLVRSGDCGWGHQLSSLRSNHGHVPRLLCWHFRNTGLVGHVLRFVGNVSFLGLLCTVRWPLRVRMKYLLYY